MSKPPIDIIVIPYHDWKKCEREGFRTRDAHLIQHMMKDPRIRNILVVNRPTPPPEMLMKRATWHVSHAGRHVRRLCRGCRLTHIGDSVQVLDIFLPSMIKPVALRQGWFFEAYGSSRCAEALRLSIQTLGLANPLFLLASPYPVDLVRQFPEIPLVLDAQDNLLKHADLKRIRPLLAHRYRYCVKHAPVIFANSMDTTRWLGQHHDDVRFLPNGVDVARFQLNGSEVPMPSDLANTARPVVGYAGKMQDMFDVDLAIHAVRHFPETQFVFIGQILNRRWMAPLWDEPNAHYLGDKHYDSLPSYLIHFDVCIIPYDVEKQHGGDPIKFYEYLAAGRPVVSTPIGALHEFTNVHGVWLPNSRRHFVDALGAALDACDQSYVDRVPQTVAWESLADRLVSGVEEAFGG